jgi:hypothetical protein
MKKLIIGLLLGAAVVPIQSHAQTVIPIQATAVSLATAEDPAQSSYLVLDIPTLAVPKQMRLEEAYFSFFMDVSSTRDDATLLAKRVALEIYPYDGTTDGKLDVSHLGTSSMKRMVKVGSGRPVRVYVTDFLVRVMKSGMSNQRMIVGSVTGDRVGVFEAKALPGTPDTKATLTLCFTPIPVDNKTSQE